MKAKKIFSLAALALMMTACGSNDDELTTPAQADGIPFTATIAADGTALTRALTENGTTMEAKWAANETIALVYKVGSENKKTKATVQSVDGSGVATITATLESGVTDGTSVTIIYPSAAANSTTGEVMSNILKNQGGTLTDVAAKRDVRKGTGTINVKSGSATLAGGATLTPQYAIWKITPQNSSGTDLGQCKSITVTHGSDVIASVPTAEPYPPFYIAVPAVSSGEITLSVVKVKDSKTYAYTKSGVTIEAGKYYQSTVKMTQKSADVKELSALTASEIGWRLCSDGKAYSATGDLPSGVTAVAVVAHVGSSAVETGTSYKGLAIAMKNASTELVKWSEEYSSTCGSLSSDVTAALARLDGIAMTEKLTGKKVSDGSTAAEKCNSGHTHAAAEAALSNNSTAIPTGTSGWFLPSAGQWNLIVKGLTGKTTDLGSSWNAEYLASNVFAKVTAAGGKASKGSIWTSTENTTGKAWYLNFNYSYGLNLTNSSNKNTTSNVRSAIAF